MARRTDPPAATVRLVRERDLFTCVRCGGIGQGLTTQHRVARGMGGSRAPWINQPANLISLCGSGTTGCHGWVEHHPEAAREHGWAVSRHHDPAQTRLWSARWGWIVLDNEGGWAHWTPAAATIP